MFSDGDGPSGSSGAASRAPTDKFKAVRKASPNDKIVLYLFGREFMDNATTPPSIDGVILVDPTYASGSNRQVYVQMVIIFGRKGDPKAEIDFEHQFCTKTLSLECSQVYPVKREIEKTSRQEALITKLGEFAFPFRIDFPKLGAPSYQMMQGSRDEQSNLGLEYEVMAFVGEDEFDEHKRSSAKMAVWRVQALPPTLNLTGQMPKGQRSKSFMMYSGAVNIDLSLDKPMYSTDDQIKVDVNIANTTSKEITDVKVKLCQRNQIPMFTDDGSHDITVQKVEDKVHIPQGGKLAREYTLTTCLPRRATAAESSWKYGQVMLEGTIGRDGKEILAASTHINHSIQMRDLYGIYVEYVVKVKCTFGGTPGETVAEAAFILTQKEESKKDA
ncbi:unnamed protein product [Meganyctiphanes norvegica]|uniref:Arrestin C-terminal-like domain-containing protein n=1 Tax=Meganyctiphanes norvegica TaxID=48144 RepID=A0AAV2QX69_MEGNR